MRLVIDQELCPAPDCENSLDDHAVAWRLIECSDCDRSILVCWECSEATLDDDFRCEKCLYPEEVETATKGW